MSKLHLDTLKRRYGWKGGKYQDLISKIIETNTRNVENKVSQLHSEHWDKALKKITPEENKFTLPNLSEVLPKRAVSILKAATSGKLISDTLRDALTKNLRDTLDQHDDQGRPRYTYTRGK